MKQGEGHHQKEFREMSFSINLVRKELYFDLLTG